MGGIKPFVNVSKVDILTASGILNFDLKNDLRTQRIKGRLEFLGFDEDVLQYEIRLFTKGEIDSYYYNSEEDYYYDVHRLFMRDLAVTLETAEEPALRFACELLLKWSIEDLQEQLEK